MSRRTLFLLLALLLLATAPWPFAEVEPDSILGFPPWAFYSLGMTLLLALGVALLLQFGWNISAGEDDDGQR